MIIVIYKFTDYKKEFNMTTKKTPPVKCINDELKHQHSFRTIRNLTALRNDVEAGKIKSEKTVKSKIKSILKG